MQWIPLHNNNTLYTLCFAEDHVVLARDHNDLEYMTRKLIEEYRRWGLEVNIGKTEKMCIEGDNQNIVLEDEREIKCCSDYKYIGLRITNDGTLDEAIKKRNTQRRQAICMLNSILWNQNISKENKKKNIQLHYQEYSNIWKRSMAD